MHVPGGGRLNRTTSMVYDAGGRVTQSTDPSGRTSFFTYNTLGQPVQAQFPLTANTPAENVSYTYGANGRLDSVTDNRGTTALAYEPTNDRASSVTDPVTGAVSHTYLLNGARSTMSLPGGGTWTYAYTGANSYGNLPKDDPNSVVPMLNTITDDQGRVCEYRTDLSGQLHECFTNRSYDALNALVGYCYTQYLYDKTGVNSNGWLTRIQNVWYAKSGSQWTSRTLTQNDYAYNNAGMRTANQISDQAGIVRTESYGYDELYRLTSVNYGDSHTQSYSFDAMGNRTQKVNDGASESYTYNAANMLLTRGANPYTNDSNGNTLTGGGRTNVWDSQNRLAQCTFGAATSAFTYAADGIRHRTVTGANTTDYVLDGPMFVREKLNGAVSATYLVGPRGPEYRRDHATGTIRWYCYDGLGSVLGECDSSGNLTATRSYDVYGAVRTSAGTSTSKHKYVGSLGHPSEDESGLIYMRARYMDPATGRFLSEDPARNGTNWFVYAAANPANRVDQSGKEALDIWELLLGRAWSEGALVAITFLLDVLKKHMGLSKKAIAFVDSVDDSLKALICLAVAVELFVLAAAATSCVGFLGALAFSEILFIATAYYCVQAVEDLSLATGIVDSPEQLSFGGLW